MFVWFITAFGAFLPLGASPPQALPTPLSLPALCLTVLLRKTRLSNVSVQQSAGCILGPVGLGRIAG